MLDMVPRQRPLVLLTSVVLAQVLLLAFQVKRDQQGQHKDMRLVRVWSVTMLTPLQRAGSYLVHRVSGAWLGYVDLRHAHRENEELRGQLAQLELRNRELESRAAETSRLTSLLGFREAHADIPMLAAEVIGASADATSHSVYINRGSKDGVGRNMAVITPEGIVGKVVEVFQNTAQVLLLTDKDSGVGALLAGTRTHGVVKGFGEPQPRMEYVVNEENVAAGDRILTSGEDRIFPKDFPVGTVASAQTGNLFKVIRVQPAARLDRLEEVFVLLTQQELELKKESEEAAGTADTKPPASAERLKAPSGTGAPQTNSTSGTAKTQPAAGLTKPPSASPGASKASAGAAKPAASAGNAKPPVKPAPETSKPAAPPN